MHGSLDFHVFTPLTASRSLHPLHSSRPGAPARRANLYDVRPTTTLNVDDDEAKLLPALVTSLILPLFATPSCRGARHAISSCTIVDNRVIDRKPCKTAFYHLNCVATLPCEISMIVVQKKLNETDMHRTVFKGGGGVTGSTSGVYAI